MGNHWPTVEKPKDVYDVVVVGGGAAGLSGAKIIARMRRSVLVVDAGTPRNAAAVGVHNYLYAEGTSPQQLGDIGRQEVRAYGVDIVEGTATAASLLADSGPGSPRFRVDVRSAAGPPITLKARRILLATGLVDELPAIPGLSARWGIDVLHCPFCHGWEARDKAIGVIGTSTMGPVQVRLFRHLSQDIVYFQHTAPDSSEDEREQMAALGVRHITGPVAALETGEDGALSRVRMVDGRAVARDAVVVASTLRVRQDLLRDLGLSVSEQSMGGTTGTYLNTDSVGATATPGVWAAGNLSSPMVQVIDAASAGAAAGSSIHFDLLDEEVGSAVTAYRASRETQPR